jgi:hypothetical protein
VRYLGLPGRGSGPSVCASGLVGRHKREQALMILTTRRATLEVGAETGKMRVGILAGDLQLHVLVEELEALLARDLESGRAENSLQRFVALVV